MLCKASKENYALELLLLLLKARPHQKAAQPNSYRYLREIDGTWDLKPFLSWGAVYSLTEEVTADGAAQLISYGSSHFGLCGSPFLHVRSGRLLAFGQPSKSVFQSEADAKDSCWFTSSLRASPLITTAHLKWTDFTMKCWCDCFWWYVKNVFEAMVSCWGNLNSWLPVCEAAALLLHVQKDLCLSFSWTGYMDWTAL